MSELIIEAPIGNYYGNVGVQEAHGKYFMGVENHNGWNWHEISKNLFDAFVAEFIPVPEST